MCESVGDLILSHVLHNVKLGGSWLRNRLVSNLLQLSQEIVVTM